MSALSGLEARRLLADSGVPFAPWVVVDRAQDAAAFGDGVAGPFAVKSAAPDVIHKSDVGCVVLNVDASGVAEAFAHVADNARAAGSGQADMVLVEQMTQPLAELVIGLKRDPTFGPVVVAGMGGVFVEVFADIALRLCPVTPDVALTMLRGLAGFGLLDGARGRPRADLDALVNLIATVSALPKRHPDITELDLNPVMALTDGAIAADARIIMEDHR